MNPDPTARPDGFGPTKRPDVSAFTNASGLQLPTLSALAGDVSNLDAYRPKALILMGRDGWAHVLPLLAQVREFPLTDFVPLNEGGMGWVVAATQTGLDRQVAIKVSKNEAAGNLGDRFAREAEKTAKLKHPNIPEIYFVGKLPGNLPFFAMEFVDGRTLEEWRPGLHIGTSIDWRDGRGAGVLKHIHDAALALDFAHSQGVVHRDVKPSNLKISDTYNAVKVLDWGLLKAGTEEALTTLVPENIPVGAVQHTRYGAVVGTLDFMSPEQAQAKHSLVGPRSDVWGLGATLYTMVCNVTPLEHWGPNREASLLRDDLEVFRKPSAVKADVPKELEAIILKAMRRNPDDRYASTRAFAADLESFLKGEPVAAYAETLGSSRRLYYIVKELRSHGEWLVSKVRDHKLKFSAATLVAIGGSYKYYEHTQDVERERVTQQEKYDRDQNALREQERLDQKRSAILTRASDRGEAATKLARQDRLGEAAGLVSPELLAELKDHDSVDSMRNKRVELERKKLLWEKLLELRQVVTEKAGGRVNSFELGKFEPFDPEDIRAVSKVFLPNGFNAEGVRLLIDDLKGTELTGEQRNEIIIRICQAQLVLHDVDYLDFNLAAVGTMNDRAHKSLKFNDLIEDLLRMTVSSGEYRAPAPIGLNRARAYRHLGDEEQSREWIARTRGVQSFAGLTDFRDGIYGLEILKADNVRMVRAAQNAFIGDPSNLLIGLTASKHLYAFAAKEKDPERRRLMMVDVVRSLEGCARLQPENPYLQAQLGRASLQLVIIEQLMPRSQRCLFQPAGIAARAFERSIALCTSRGIPIPDDLRFDYGYVLVEGGDGVVGAPMLEKLKGKTADPFFLDLLIESGHAQARLPVNREVGETLLKDATWLKKHPFHSLCILARLGAENPDERNRYHTPAVAALVLFLRERPEMLENVQLWLRGSLSDLSQYPPCITIRDGRIPPG